MIRYSREIAVLYIHSREETCVGTVSYTSSMGSSSVCDQRLDHGNQGHATGGAYTAALPVCRWGIHMLSHTTWSNPWQVKCSIERGGDDTIPPLLYIAILFILVVGAPCDDASNKRESVD